MKRILSLILSIIMIFSLCACGNKEKAEKYCSSCGEGISKDAAFCEHCGAAVNNEKTESEDDSSDSSSSTENKTEETSKQSSVAESISKPTNTSNKPSSNNTPSTSNTSSSTEGTSKPTNTSNKPSSNNTPSTSNTSSSTEGTSKPTDTSSKPSSNNTPNTSNTSSSSKPADTSKPSTPTHTHSYSKKVTAATCTEKGYTTYTCSCGDTYKSDYTNPSHTYTEFICHPCGAIDKQNAYQYLVDYVKTNGKVNGSYKSITMREVNGKKYELKYDAQNKCLWATCREATQSAVLTTAFSIEDGYYGLNYVYNSSITSDLTGFIEPKTFNENSAMTYEVYTGLDSAKVSMLNLARSSLVLTIVEMERYFDTYNVGVNVYALGYMGLQ